MSGVAPEVLVTKPSDKDRDGQNEATQGGDKKSADGKNYLALLPVSTLTKGIMQ